MGFSHHCFGLPPSVDASKLPCLQSRTLTGTSREAEACPRISPNFDGDFPGTVSFKAPEALQDPQGDSLTGDVWALGTSLYLLLTDQLPYDVDEGNAVAMSEAFRKSPAPPSRWNALCDTELDRLVLKALNLDPHSRYPSASEFLSALESWKQPTAKSGKQPDRPSDRGTTSKAILGTTPQQRKHAARQLALRSIAMAQDSAKLSEACKPHGGSA